MDGAESQASNLQGNVIRFASSFTFEVQSFESILSGLDIQGATLTEADLEASINIDGEIFAPQGTMVTGFGSGGLTLGPLEIDLDFSQFDGVASENDLISINESDSGFDVTEAGDDLSFFLNSNAPVLVEISASFEYSYDNTSQIGNLPSLFAAGSFDLVTRSTKRATTAVATARKSCLPPRPPRRACWPWLAL